MPRENRKRGKKNKAKSVVHPQKEHFQQISNVPTPDTIAYPEEAPFGVVHPDLKGYFRTVDDQLRTWQEETPHASDELEVDPNEDRRMFFTAALSEMNGHELQLATDSVCSSILERMLYSMDDFVRRVFTDRLAGSWLQIITDRFASHVCQTLFTVTAETIARECRGIFPPLPASGDNNHGELLTMINLVLNACQDILPDLSRLIQDPFASHVLRALLLLLSPQQLASESRHSKHASSVRSKKSARWNARRGPMKSVIANDVETDDKDEGGSPPPGFTEMASRFVDRIRKELGENEVRALAIDKIASPLLQMLLRLEASFGKADNPGSLMDDVLAGLITSAESPAMLSVSPYVTAMFRDTTSSHLLESIMPCCSSKVFICLWDVYIRPDLPKLAIHPVSNFVVARAVQRLDPPRLGDAMAQLESTWGRSYKVQRTSVLNTVVQQASQIEAHESGIVEVICSMSELNTEEQRKTIVPCVLQLKTFQEYLSVSEDKNVNQEDHTSQDESGLKRIGLGPEGRLSFQPAIQGSILLQSMLRLHDPHNHIILESLYSLLPAELLVLAQDATSSRIFDAVFESPTVTLRSRLRVVTLFMGQYHLLCDDRIGSHVADRCWENADPYLKEKIARSLMPHEQFLAGSKFGRFFARGLKLNLFQRNLDQWKRVQSKSRTVRTDANAVPITSGELPSVEADSAAPSRDSERGLKRKKRGINQGDEIDTLFEGIGANKRAKGFPKTVTAHASSVQTSDSSLDAVLGAIKGVSNHPGCRRKNK